MGIYWTAVCDKAKEFIEPHALKGQGAKGHEITHPHSSFGPLVLETMMDRWSGQKVRLVPEFDSYDYEQYGYKDVSLKAIEDFNRSYPDRKIEPAPDWGKDNDLDDDPVVSDPAPKVVETRLVFEQLIPAGATVEIDEHKGFLRKNETWVEVPPEKVGRFRAKNLEAECKGLIVKRIDVKDEKDETKKRNQMVTSPGIPVEVFAPGLLGGGVLFESCFPELLSITVSNPTNEPKLCKMVMVGVSIVGDR